MFFSVHSFPKHPPPTIAPFNHEISNNPVNFQPAITNSETGKSKSFPSRVYICISYVLKYQREWLMFCSSFLFPADNCRKQQCVTHINTLNQSHAIKSKFHLYFKPSERGKPMALPLFTISFSAIPCRSHPLFFSSPQLGSADARHLLSCYDDDGGMALNVSYFVLHVRP